LNEINGMTIPPCRLHEPKRNGSAEERLDYIVRIGRYEARQLVFVDESSLDRRDNIP
jgi:hypothetical protein